MPGPALCLSLLQVLRNRKARAYLALLLGRAAAFAFFMLRSNAIRKRKTRGARHHRRHVILRTAYQSWKLRVFLSAELQRCLSGVFHQVCMLLLQSNSACCGFRFSLAVSVLQYVSD